MNQPIFKHLKLNLYALEVTGIVLAITLFYFTFPIFIVLFHDFLWGITQALAETMAINW